MRVKRLASSDAVVAAAPESEAEHGLSLSARLSEPAELRPGADEGLLGVAEWEAEAGALTAEERATGEVLLDELLRGA